MPKNKTFLLWIWVISGISFPLETTAQDYFSSFKLMFYNVENLFDCYPDSLKDDSEFLPSSIRAWNYQRYKKKLADISKVITAVGEWDIPAVIGLCEVENNRVMDDLTKRSPLKEYSYRYVMTDSPDERGIDVALLYQRDKFKLIEHHSIPVELKKGKGTRDILHVCGIVLTLDTLDLFVVHFPSRSGGEKESEPNRIKAATTLKNYADSIVGIRKDARIIIMGDFNDYPHNKSITHTLKAGIPGSVPENNKLYHLLARKAKEPDYGSYKYQGQWGLLDHLIVSGNLLKPDSSIFTSEEKAHVVRIPFLLEKDEKYGGMKPFRTYNGMKYQGGYSDHLPVVAEFNIIINKF